MMRPDVKRSYIYHQDVDYFPVTTSKDLFLLYHSNSALITSNVTSIYSLNAGEHVHTILVPVSTYTAAVVNMHFLYEAYSVLVFEMKKAKISRWLPRKWKAQSPEDVNKC